MRDDTVYMEADDRSGGLAHTRIRGDVDIDLRRVIDEYRLIERQCVIRCASGDRFSGRWRGIAFPDLLTEIEPTATHLIVTADDGFRACISIRDAMDGILAVERLDAESSGLPRAIVPTITGTRMVKRVVRLEGHSLSPAEDPRARERLEPSGTE